MKNQNRCILLVLALSFFASCFFTTNIANSQTAGAEIFLKHTMKELRIPGMQVAVVKQGQIVLLKSYGFANIQDSVPVTTKSIFAINSCTKAFTGVAVMQLVEEGKMDLSAPVSKYLDSLPDPKTHGLGAMRNEDAVWEKIKAMPMDFKTGEQFSYNQTNYVLLGKIIEKFRGMPFTQVAGERQFKMVGMPNTIFGDSRDIIPHFAPSYSCQSKIDGQKLSVARLVNTYTEFPLFWRTCSGLNSTAEDIAKWIIALQHGKLLEKKASLDTLWTAGSYNNGTPTQWALGWVTKPRPQHKAIIATGGGRSAFFVYPDDDLAIVVLTNLPGASPEDFIDELAGYFNPEIPAADPITSFRILLKKRGFENAREVFAELQKKNAKFKLLEVDLNDWAYRLMSKDKNKEALEIFKLNVFLYPESWNVYDSYGEILLKMGFKEEGIKMYKRSIELNPDNEGGKKAIERISK